MPYFFFSKLYEDALWIPPGGLLGALLGAFWAGLHDDDDDDDDDL